MEPRTVQISGKWVGRLTSPLGLVAEGLSGVGATFAPLFLYWYGQGHRRPFGWPPEIGIPLCWLSIFFPAIFYFRLARHVKKQLK
jgi:hypothetical protein